MSRSQVAHFARSAVLRVAGIGRATDQAMHSSDGRVLPFHERQALNLQIVDDPEGVSTAPHPPSSNPGS